MSIKETPLTDQGSGSKSYIDTHHSSSKDDGFVISQHDKNPIEKINKETLIDEQNPIGKINKETLIDEQGELHFSLNICILHFSLGTNNNSLPFSSSRY